MRIDVETTRPALVLDEDAVQRARRSLAEIVSDPDPMDGLGLALARSVGDTGAARRAGAALDAAVVAAGRRAQEMQATAQQHHRALRALLDDALDTDERSGAAARGVSSPAVRGRAERPGTWR